MKPKPGPHKHTKHFLLAFAGLFALFLAWIVYLFVATRLEHKRAMELVMALETHFDKLGRYPDRLEELKQSAPGFDPAAYADYDQSANCVRAPAYCRELGEYVVVYPEIGMALCKFRLGVDYNFICGD